jgi:predicted DNA-binding protein with PD1-like motif
MQASRATVGGQVTGHLGFSAGHLEVGRGQYSVLSVHLCQPQVVTTTMEVALYCVFEALCTLSELEVRDLD